MSVGGVVCMIVRFFLRILGIGRGMSMDEWGGTRLD